MRKILSPSTTRIHIRASKEERLGNWTPTSCFFENIEHIVEEFKAIASGEQSETVSFDVVSRKLLSLIQQAKAPCFLLPAVVDFIDRINCEKIIDRYTLVSFELFLNVFAQISLEENREIRAKIVGKSIPRDKYQVIFPVGMGKVFPGTHFVTAHGSPDLDTTVASFWGWVDAFGCRVSDGLHVWNIPDGPPKGQAEISFLFLDIFGKNVFSYIAKTRTSLSVSGLDLMSERGMMKRSILDSAIDLGDERNLQALVLVDPSGYYVGDWHHIDAEGVSQVNLLFTNMLRWFENDLQMKLLTLFGKNSLCMKDVSSFAREVLEMKLLACAPVRDFSEKQKKNIETFFVRVLGVSLGLETTFFAFAESMKKLSLHFFQNFVQLIESLPVSPLFDATGQLIEDRRAIFHYLEQVITGLDVAIQSVQNYVERLDIALYIKTQVFGYKPQHVSSRADIEEIRGKMGRYPYLTVTASDRLGNLFPMGIIPSSYIYRPILGTVTLRDFCNREETKIPPYLEVISVLDHHKSHLQTSSTPVVHISDAQSSNTMLAEIAFGLNDSFSSMGMDSESINKQLQEAMHNLSTSRQKRIVQRLLQKQLNLERSGPWFISADREYLEYLHFLYAILDDTDLLTKASIRDLDCVASLLNRLKTLSLGKEVEVIDFDEISMGEGFAASASTRLLQNDELYSLYSKMYAMKEKAVEHNIETCIHGKTSAFFADVKEQNGCCRIGQTKLFAKNIPFFVEHVQELRKIWLRESRLMHKEKLECDLHIHMISTLSSADDLYHGSRGAFVHRDEMWIWIPREDAAIEHLKSFLAGFRSLATLHSPLTDVEFLGSNAADLDTIFTESFLPVPREIIHKGAGEGIPIAVLRFKAGAVNSRKAQVVPFLPKHLSQ